MNEIDCDERSKVEKTIKKVPLEIWFEREKFLIEMKFNFLRDLPSLSLPAISTCQNREHSLRASPPSLSIFDIVIHVSTNPQVDLVWWCKNYSFISYTFSHPMFFFCNPLQLFFSVFCVWSIYIFSIEVVQHKKAQSRRLSFVRYFMTFFAAPLELTMISMPFWFALFPSSK